MTHIADLDRMLPMSSFTGKTDASIAGSQMVYIASMSLRELMGLSCCRPHDVDG